MHAVRSTVLGVALALFVVHTSATAQDDGAAAFAEGLLRTRALMEARDWKGALAALGALLDAHADREYVRVRRVEIETIHKRCAFGVAHGALAPQDALSGKLLAWSATTGRIKILYTPKTLGDDFRKDGPLQLFTGRFESPHCLTVEGRELPDRPPAFFVCLRRDYQDACEILVELGAEGGQVTLRRVKAVHRGLVQNAIPKQLIRPNYTIRIRVDRDRVSVYYGSRRVASMEKPADLFGSFALRPFPFAALTVEGKIQRSWVDTRTDLALAKKREAFEKSYDARKSLPAWLFEAAKPAADEEPDESLPEDIPAKHLVRLKRALVLIGRGKFERVEKALADPPSEPRILGAYRFVRAVALLAQGAYDRALTACEEAQAAHPDFLPAKILLATILARCGNRPRALELLGALAATRVNEPEVYSELGRTWLLEGEPARARAALEDGFRSVRKTKELETVYRLIVKAEMGPSWSRRYEYKTPNYHVVSDIDRKTCCDAARILEDAYRAFNVGLKWTKGADHERFRVYLFSTQKAYLNYTEDVMGVSPAQSAGLFSPYLKQLLIWDLPDREQMMRTVRHEGFHQYLDRVMPDPPRWFNEGLAEYYETSEYRGGEWRTGLRRADHVLHLDRTRPLAEFLRLTPAEFYKDASRHYAQGWALVYFLLHGPDPYPRLFEELFEALQRTEPGVAVVDRIFGRIGAARVERDFRAFVARLRG